MTPYYLSGQTAEEQMYQRRRRERLLHPSLLVRVWWWFTGLFIVELACALVVEAYGSVFCIHSLRFLRNIYGDEINHAGGKRSVWRCRKCGVTRLKDRLCLERE